MSFDTITTAYRHADPVQYRCRLIGNVRRREWDGCGSALFVGRSLHRGAALG